MNSSLSSNIVQTLYKPIRILAMILLIVIFYQAFLMFRYSRKVKNPEISKELKNTSYASLGVVLIMGYLMNEG